MNLREDHLAPPDQRKVSSRVGETGRWEGRVQWLGINLLDASSPSPLLTFFAGSLLGPPMNTALVCENSVCHTGTSPLSSTHLSGIWLRFGASSGCRRMEGYIGQQLSSWYAPDRSLPQSLYFFAMHMPGRSVKLPGHELLR